jgi:hypothetical protein
MRPLPIVSVAGTPSFVRGVSLIRGLPTPVVDLKSLLDLGESSPNYGRFVSLKLEERRVVIGVDSVVGLKHLDLSQLGELRASGLRRSHGSVCPSRLWRCGCDRFDASAGKWGGTVADALSARKPPERRFGFQ